jgi:HAMP domain-containing protein
MILPRLKLQTRTLVMTTGLALLPFALMALGIFTQVRGALMEKAESDHRSIVSRLLHSFDSDFARLTHRVELLAQDMRIQGMKLDQVHEALHTFLEYDDSFLSIYLYDRDGVTRFIEYRNHFTGANKYLNKRVGDASARLGAQVSSVTATGKTTSFDYLRKESSDSQLLILVAVPSFSGSGPNMGVLSIAIQMYSHQYQDFLDQIELEGRSYILILDRKGRVLARRGTVPHGPSVANADLAASGGLAPILASVEVPDWDPAQGEATRWMRADDHTDLITVAPYPRLGATVLVGRPASEVLGLLESITMRFWTFAALGLGLSVIGALALSRSLARRVLELADGIKKVGEGATGHRVSVEGADELAEAGDAFNRMAEQLQKGKLMEQIWSRQWEDDK